MKVCVFSDIHGNGPAFNVACKMIVAEDADINVFLGDLCGYYYDQLEIYDRMAAIPRLLAVKGNHDSVFLSVASGDNELRQKYKQKYGYSMELLLEKDTAELRKWLSQLPESCFLSDLALSCYHGSPWNFMEGYVYPDDSLDLFEELSQSFFLLGHTHYPMVRNAGNKLIMNPGSLGQPRNGGWPTYALLNITTGQVLTREVIYDKAEVIRSIDKVGDKARYLKEVLGR